MSAAPTLPDAEVRQLVQLRRDLHRHPELSWKETGTAARLERELAELGAADLARVAGTGIVARIPGQRRDAPVVAVRGDIDALPIAEATGLPYASEAPGVMHACGHDVHATWTVGAAMLLRRSPAPGDVLIVLQPAEEVGQGALAILESGALDNVRAIFGGHVDRRFEVGQVVAQPGPLAASTDTFDIELLGSGAHGARPHESADPVVGMAALITAFQTIISRRLDPALPGVITVGTVQAGTAANIIPDRARLSGTIRATTPESRILLTSALHRMAESVAETHGLAAHVVLRDGTPPVLNDPSASAWAQTAVTTVLGPAGLVPLGTVNMGGEDFAYYQERMPGCFMRIGAREPGGERTPAHSPRFHAAEGAIAIGAMVLAETARVASTALAAG